MIFGASLGADVIGPIATVRTPTVPSSGTGCSPLLTTQRAQLFSQVSQGIFKMQQAIDNGAPVDSSLAMNLADQSRRLGKVQGQIDACQPVAKTASQLHDLLQQNSRDMLLSELRLNEAWSAKDYRKWLSLRNQIQTYHREVTKLQGWLARVAPATATGIIPLLPINATTTSIDTSSGGGGGGELSPKTPHAIVDPALLIPEEPFYRKGWFWGLLGGGLAVGLGVYALSR
jgi:hypothetical protein